MPETGPFADLPLGSLRVLQITDTHLHADPNAQLMGLNTLDSLDSVLALARHALHPVDLVLATGDMVHDASPQGYARLRDRLASLGAPVYCLPGNHDQPQQMREHSTGQGVQMLPWVRQGNWLLIFLDSTVPNEVGGHLRSSELARLEKLLAQHPDLHSLVCLHHHPLDTGSAWMDSMAVDNAEQLMALIARHQQVRGMLWGHIHQEFDRMENGVRCLGSPSTCIQFAPGRPDFGVDSATPGYRWLALQPDGKIRTGVHRLSSMPGLIDLASGGY